MSIVSRYARLIFTLFLSVAVGLVGLSMFKESFINLNAATKKQGEIVLRKIGENFSFTITGTSVVYNVYKASRNYSEFARDLVIGDTVTVYSVNSTTANLQVVQIEKGGRIIVDKSLLEGQNRAGVILSLFAVPVFIALAVREFVKSKRKSSL